VAYSILLLPAQLIRKTHEIICFSHKYRWTCRLSRFCFSILLPFNIIKGIRYHYRYRDHYRTLPPASFIIFTIYRKAEFDKCLRIVFVNVFGLCFTYVIRYQSAFDDFTDNFTNSLLIQYLPI